MYWSFAVPCVFIVWSADSLTADNGIAAKYSGKKQYRGVANEGAVNGASKTSRIMWSEGARWVPWGSWYDSDRRWCFGLVQVVQWYSVGLATFRSPVRIWPGSFSADREQVANLLCVWANSASYPLRPYEIGEMGVSLRAVVDWGRKGVTQFSNVRKLKKTPNALPRPP